MPSCAEAIEVEEPPQSSKRPAEDDPDWPVPKRPRSRAEKYVCSVDGCEKSYSRPCRLQEHMNTHTGERPFKCYKCDKTFKKSSHLREHQRTHLPVKKYTCTFPECTVSCTTRQHLKTHELLHTTPNPYKCTEYPPCNASFRKKHLLRAHITDEHTHMPAYPCPHADEGCQAAFPIQAKLRQHLKKRHTLRYFCDECDAGFILLLDMQRHKRDDHPPRCFTCGLECATKDVLLKHLEIHKTSLDQRKRFPCDVEGCGKRYTTAYALKTHVNTVHDKVKPYVCEWEGCGRSFGFKKVLDRHVWTHTNPAPPRERKRVIKEVGLIDGIVGTGDTGRDIACQVQGCDYKFTRNYDLKRHLASMHKDLGLGLELVDAV